MLGAIIGGALALGGSLLAGKSAESAAETSASAAEAATKYATDIEYKMFKESQAMMEPWVSAGMWGLGQLVGKEGLGDLTPIQTGTETVPVTRTSGGPSSTLGRAAPTLAGGAGGYIDWQHPEDWDPGGVYADFPQYAGAHRVIPSLPPGFTGGGAASTTTQYEERPTYTERTLPEGIPETGLLQAGPGEFEESPGYQFRLAEGRKAIERAASAGGRLASGRTIKEALRYSQEYASNEYDKFLARYYQKLEPYFKLAGYGGSAAESSAQMATQTGANLAQTAASGTMAAGNARVSGYINQGNIWGNLLGQGAQGAFQYGLMQDMGLFNNSSSPGLTQRQMQLGV